MEEGAAANMTGEKRVAVDVDVPADANAHGAEEKAAAASAEEDHLPAPAALSGWRPRRTGLYLFVMNIRCVPALISLTLHCLH